MGIVASPPRPQPEQDAGADTVPPVVLPEVGTIAHAPDAPDAGAPKKPVLTPQMLSPTVGTTATAPDRQPPSKK